MLNNSVDKQKLAKEHLKSLVRSKFSKPLDSNKSFEELSEITKLSYQTLRRIFGKIESDRKTYESSLSLLSNFVGFQDWQAFLTDFSNGKKSNDLAQLQIDFMEVFFSNGEKYNTDYFQKTSTVETLNDYAKIIYASRENFEYFYTRYKENNWAADYILAWIPNYNFFGQQWFRAILIDKIKRTTISHVKLSQTNFLCLGAFLTCNDNEFDIFYKDLKLLYETAKAQFGYLPYHEMRYATVCLMAHDSDQERIVYQYLKEFNKQNLTAYQRQELLVFFSNTLFWLGIHDSGYSLINKSNFNITELLKPSDMESLHYYGMNNVFFKLTASLTFLANGNRNIEKFEIGPSDFSHPSTLLYSDYTHLLNITQSILLSTTVSQKKKLFDELVIIVNKTNYHQIYKVLKGIDSTFSTYSLT